jgi:hypothetical protein
MMADRPGLKRRSRWDADDFGTMLVGVTLFSLFGSLILLGLLSSDRQPNLWGWVVAIWPLGMALLLIVLYIVSVIRRKPMFSDSDHAKSDQEPMIWD